MCASSEKKHGDALGSGEARAKIDALKEELAGMNVFVVPTAKNLTVDTQRRKDLTETIKRDGPLYMERDQVKKKSCCDMESFGGVYNVQEAVPNIEPPRFSLVPSFNYEAAAA